MEKRFNLSGRGHITARWFYAHYALVVVAGVLWQFHAIAGVAGFAAAGAALLGGILSAAKESEAYDDR